MIHIGVKNGIGAGFRADKYPRDIGCSDRLDDIYLPD